MAWNGSNGVNAGSPEYVTFTAWRNTPLEDAAREFLLARAGLPLGALLFTFGTPQHARRRWLDRGDRIDRARAGRAEIDDRCHRPHYARLAARAAHSRRANTVESSPACRSEAKVDAMNVYARSAGGAAWAGRACARRHGRSIRRQPRRGAERSLTCRARRSDQAEFRTRNSGAR